MREIKFRAWSPSLKKWRSDWSISEYTEVLDLNATRIDDDLILCQCTGLKDKNGKKIYEGDILKCNFQEEEVGVIEWIECGFWIQWPTTRSLPNQEYREVIGNIYENPDLLK